MTTVTQGLNLTGMLHASVGIDDMVNHLGPAPVAFLAIRMLFESEPRQQLPDFRVVVPAFPFQETTFAEF